MRIESLHVKNFRVFRDILLSDLPNMCVFLGANGTGKTTLFDVFGFLKDALTHNVRQATQKRGGFNELKSRDSQGPISIEIKFRTDDTDNLATYYLEVDEKDSRPVVSREILKFRRGRRYGSPWHFLDFSYGKGKAIENESALENSALNITDAQRIEQELDSPDILAIKGLGQFQRFQTASSFRKLIENWHVSDFHISDVRPSQEAGYAEHLSVRGDNAPLVAQYMFEYHKEIFDSILIKMAERVPGISNVQAAETEDGRIVLKFQDGNFKDPFIAKYVSDGTIKMFAYLLLLYDPVPHPLLCVEEPENQLYPRLLSELAEEFSLYAQRGGQVFVSTHSPDFLNAVELSNVFWLTKVEGYTIIKRASESEVLRNMVEEGDRPGWLWKEGLFDGADPE